MQMRRANLQGAEDSANLLLGMLNIDDPDAMPVDPEAIAEALDLKVVTFGPDKFPELNPAPWGFFVRSENTIFVNRDQSNTRRRFTIAHEIGHFLMHKEDLVDVQMRNDKSSAGTDPAEIEANRFAAALLMPEGLFRPLATSFTVDRLASYFNVSPAAADLRLRTLYRLA